MRTVLCTLYNSMYLDKGLVLYDSLCKCAKDFKLYVLCMDEKCYEVLMGLKQEHHIPVRLVDFEEGDEELLVAKTNRPLGEYCWTCSSSFIRYVLKHYGEESCTYIDADMYFYNDPKVLIDEMRGAGKSVMVVPHRFPEAKIDLAQKVGIYCVEFNTFLNTPESLEVLEYWRGRCLDCCKNLGDGVHWGDQKYLEELVERFRCIYVCENRGAGVAPWNIVNYKMLGKNLTYKDQVFPIIFYHYQGLSYINRYFVNIGIQKEPNIDYLLIKNLYNVYLSTINRTQSFLKAQYGLDCLIRLHPSLKQRWRRIKQSIIGQILQYISLRFRTNTIILRVK